MAMKKSRSVVRRAAGKRRAGRTKTKRVQPVPEGYHTITPHIILDDCAGAIQFYKTAFGAKERGRMSGPGGKIVHAEIRIGDSIVMLNDEMPSMSGQPGVYMSPRTAGLATGALFLYVEDVDAVFNRAKRAGCVVRQPPTDMFWGDRYGQVMDPFGHTWAFATRLEDLTPRQLEERQRAAFDSMGQGSGAAPS
jgi:PhnB protein